MTVVNNILNQDQSRYSSAEIDAARNAFYRHDRDKQVHLLTVMPMDEAIAILQTSPASFSRSLIDELKDQGHNHHARYYINQLGLHKKSVSLDWLISPIGLVSMTVVGLISGVSAYVAW
ncbi:hypothetical protein [Vibrio marisflavi]|nr:hypothetical protein [Vibrio marisflavi]